MNAAAKVLIVEDEVVVAQDLAGILSRLGYEITGIAETGEEAIVLAAATQPDLALMDVRLKGGLDGIEAATRIKQESDTAIIYLTGNSERRTRDRAKTTEPFAYLLKPFEERMVETYLEMALAKHQAERKWRAAQEELRRQERLATLGKLAGSVAHEMRTPLAVLQNTITYLEMASPGSHPGVQEALNEANRAIKSCDHIIKEMLDYVREVPPARAVCQLEAIVAEALRQVPFPPTVRILGLEEDIGAEIYANEDQVTRILVNLLQNAAHVMAEGGELRLGVERTGDEISLEVSDTGCGIPPEDLERVFEPLFSTKIRGIGLGLAIARRYAVLNGGQLVVESEPGRGASFRLRLPRP